MQVERYLHGPMPDINTEQPPPEEIAAVCKGVLQETRQWSSRHPSNLLINPAIAVSVLGELSPGGALMRGFQEQSLARKYRQSRYNFHVESVYEFCTFLR